MEREGGFAGEADKMAAQLEANRVKKEAEANVHAFMAEDEEPKEFDESSPENQALIATEEEAKLRAVTGDVENPVVQSKESRLKALEDARAEALEAAEKTS